MADPYRPDVVVHGDAERLQQVFLNLILNAVDAMEGGGELRLTLRTDGDFAEAVAAVIVDSVSDSEHGSFSAAQLAVAADLLLRELSGLIYR